MTNPQTMTPPETLYDAIDRINATPMPAIRFAMLAKLKSGFDELSRTGIDSLRERLSIADLNAIDDTFPEDQDRKSAVRWRLRGLDIDRTIRKVKTDAEIGRNAGNRPAQPDRDQAQRSETNKPR
ncbi:hypothetical protein LF1_41470 [Rubripirellula obstinata]|uniref:Uncharacterized protein n=1 Tax=Rubripirellula obstinata TaxID=406547 RepID=A0A5B1CM31_9BACT|nr:hypothetical protein [Rubripirellula obstinata]KAA1261596.1 hypothetical protein LF1_41470 [Rubripirellula obstinata]